MNKLGKNICGIIEIFKKLKIKNPEQKSSGSATKLSGEVL